MINGWAFEQMTKPSHSSFSVLWVFLCIAPGSRQQNSFRGMTDLLGHGYIIMAPDNLRENTKMDRDQPHLIFLKLLFIWIGMKDAFFSVQCQKSKIFERFDRTYSKLLQVKEKWFRMLCFGFRFNLSQQKINKKKKIGSPFWYEKS